MAIIGKDITTQAIGFTKITYGISCLPYIPYSELKGFSNDGINWDDIEIATVDKGADGLFYINQKPCIYSVTINLLANSPNRNVLDLLASSLTPKLGHTINTATMEFIQNNETTGYKNVYTGGIITTAQGGDNANKDSGQLPKVYKLSFAEMVQLPL